MKSTLPASHLMRQYMLFTLTVIFLLTVIRAAYGLWLFPRLDEANAVLSLFVQGLRFDLALIGLVCLVPVVLGSLLAMFNSTRALARILVSSFLLAGLLLVLLLELLTPWFIDTRGLRPDLALLASVENPVEVIMSVVADHAVPLAIGVMLCGLIMIAYWLRMEMPRFLRYRLARPSALFLAIIGGLVCLVAIWSKPDLRKPVFSPADSNISQDQTVNELSMNSAYKTVFALLFDGAVDIKPAGEPDN